MKGLSSLIRVRTWELDERRKELSAVQERLESVRKQQEHLESEIETQKAAALESIEASMAFSNYHQRAVMTRTQLQQAYDEIAQQVEAAQEKMADAFQDVKQFEKVKEIIDEEEAAELARKEAELMDEIGLNLHRRRQNAEQSES